MYDDMRHGIRALWRQPAFTLVTVGALALGIGASAAIFSVVTAVLLRPLPFADPDRLVIVWDRVARLGLDRNGVSPSNFVDWQKQNTVFKGMDAWTEHFLNLGGDDGPAERVYGLGVTSAFFETIGVRPPIGRGFRAEDAPTGERTTPRPVLISHGLWQRRFGGQASVLGRTLRLNGRSAQVIGILPSDFLFLGKRFDVVDTMAFSDDQVRNWRARRWLTVVARLAPGVTVAQAQAGMDTVTARLAEQYPDANQGRGAYVRSLVDELVGDARPALYLLQAAVGLVLLIAATNVAHLQLVRSLTRARELAIRAALGATRARLVRQLFTEGLILAMAGGTAGVLMAAAGTRAIVAMSPADVPRVEEARVDGGVLLFALMIAAGAAVICGLLPALQTSRADLRQALDEGGRSGRGGARPRLQGMLVAAEVALSLILLVGAGLLVKSFVRLQRVDPGFGAQDAVALDLSLGPAYGDPPARALAFERILARLEALPGVRSAGITTDLPLSGETSRRSFTIVDDMGPLPNAKHDAEIRRVSASYFDAMGMALRRGRGFDAAAADTIVINEAMARRFFAGADPIGRRLRIEDGPLRPREIVGVVGDVKHFGLDAAAPPEIYLSHLDRPWPSMTVVVRAATGDPAALLPGIRAELAAIDKNLPAANVKTIAQYLAGSVSRPRFSARLFALFALVALVLAAVGLYGVVAYAVAQRTPEIGIRMALGADAPEIVRMVVSDGLRPVWIGIASGLAGALLLAHTMGRLLYETRAHDPVVLAGVTTLLLAVAIVACWWPARAAARVDPMVCVR